ncbi:MAG: tRNA dimethylallyltransferase, partial [Candidatus Izemoplasmatales bacterium]|nr:tRNA dimethylallyltransferase [Candidatus Izemoplasmatales bacterium]
NVRNDNTSETYKELTTEELAKILIEEKPLLAKKCDLSNRRRVLRALEKEDKDIQTNLFPFYQNAQVIGLNIERDLLYQRIDKRVEEMFEEGLIQEVKNLYLKGINSQAISAIGYKELYDYFNGKTTLEEAKNLIKRNSRRYAKRQLTWFNNKLKVNWFNVDPTNFTKTIEEVKKMIKKEVV